MENEFYNNNPFLIIFDIVKFWFEFAPKLIKIMRVPFRKLPEYFLGENFFTKFLSFTIDKLFNIFKLVGLDFGSYTFMEVITTLLIGWLVLRLIDKLPIL